MTHDKKKCAIAMGVFASDKMMSVSRRGRYVHLIWQQWLCHFMLL